MVFRIPLGGNKFTYGQIIDEVGYGFLDFLDDGENTDIQQVLSSKMLYRLLVDYGVLNDGIWEVLGIYPVKAENAERRDKFNYDYMKERYVIVKENMVEVPSTPEEIRKLGLECFASWGHKSVEDRLRDHFAGRKCYWVEESLNEHNPDFPDIETFYRQQGYDYVWKGDSEEE